MITMTRVQLNVAGSEFYQILIPILIITTIIIILIMITMTRVQLNVAGYEFYGQAELPQQAKHNASTQVQGGGSSQLSPHLGGHIQNVTFFMPKFQA